jgi:hypothetical protein
MNAARPNPLRTRGHFHDRELNKHLHDLLPFKWARWVRLTAPAAMAGGTIDLPKETVMYDVQNQTARYRFNARMADLERCYDEQASRPRAAFVVEVAALYQNEAA